MWVTLDSAVFVAFIALCSIKYWSVIKIDGQHEWTYAFLALPFDFFAFSYADIFIWYSTRNPCYRRENRAMPL